MIEVTKAVILIIYNNRNNIVNSSSISDSENRNIKISDNEDNSIATNNVVNRSTGYNHVNIINFLNNECVNIYVKWYRLYSFLLVGRDEDIIDLKYKKKWNDLCLRIRSFLAIILKRHSWCYLRLFLQKLCLGIILLKGCYFDVISAN